MFFVFEPISLPALMILAGFSSCDARPAPEILVDLDFGQVKYDLSKSYAELERFDITTISPYAAHEHTRVAGLTGGKIKIQSDVNIAWSTSALSRNNCFWIEDVKIDIELDSTIYIASENRKNRCSYTQIKNHEWQHVQTDRALLEEFRPRFEQTAREAVRRIGVVGPLPESENLETRRRIARIVEIALGRVSDEMNRERRQRQQAIDSRDEYDRLSGVCE